MALSTAIPFGEIIGALRGGETAGDLIIDDAQFGAKIGKHAEDFGLNPADPVDRQAMRDLIKYIFEHPDEIRRVPWNPKGGGGADYLFYRLGSEVVVTTAKRQFVTILRYGIYNGWFKGATAIR